MDVANLLLRITGNNDDAKRALNEVAARVRALATEEAEARIRVDGGAAARAEIESLDRSLDAIGRRNVTARVRVQIDHDRQRLANLRRELDLSLAGGAGARPLRTIMAEMAEVSSSIARTGAQAGSTILRLGGAAADAGASIGSSLVSSLISAVPAVLALIAVGAILVGVLGAILGVVGALAASLLAAAAGFAALVTSGIALAIPALLVFVGLIARVVGAVKALQDQEANAAQHAENMARAEQARADAAEAAAEARKRVAETYQDALDAEKNAALDARDAELSLQNARLGITDADLRLERAKLNLREVREEARRAGPAFANLWEKFRDIDTMSPAQVRSTQRQIRGLPGENERQLRVKEALQEVAHAQLGVKEAKLAELRATQRLSEAQERNNEFAREGVMAYEPYAAALEASKDASERLAETQADIVKIQRQRNEETKKYSKQELGVAAALITLFKDVKRTFQTAMEPALDGLMSMIKAISEVLKDSRIEAAIRNIGEAFGFVFESFGKMMRTERAKELFRDMLNLSARLVRVVGGRVFTNLFMVLLEIGREAGPPLIRLFNRFGRWLESLNDGAEGTERVRGAVRRVLRSFEVWLGVARALARVVINFIKAAIDDGDGLARSFKRVFNRFADFLNTDEGRAKVKTWLRESIDLVREMVNAFANLVEFLNNVFGVMQDIAGVVQDIAGAAADIVPGGHNPVEDIKTINRFKEQIRDAPTVRDRERIRRTARSLFPGVKFAEGGLVTQRVFGELGEAGREAVIPLKDSVLAGIGAGIVEALGRVSGASAPALAGAVAGGGGVNIGNIILPPAPGHDQLGDPRVQAVELARELHRRGGGGPI